MKEGLIRPAERGFRGTDSFIVCFLERMGSFNPYRKGV